MVTREQLIAPSKRPIERVTLPDRGEIMMRGMSAGELISFQRSLQPNKKNGAVPDDDTTLAAKLIVRCIVDKDGNRLLQDDDWKYVLSSWSGAELIATQSVIMRLNGYGSAEGND
jgi:hypothetical protein